MAYDCYFASVMQTEFLEQGTSFHLVSHRESIYGYRRHSPAGDYLETNLHPIWVWGARGGGGVEGLGGGERAWGLEIFLVVSIYKTRLNCWCLAERALFGPSRSGALGLGRRIIFLLFYLVGIIPVM